MKSPRILFALLLLPALLRAQTTTVTASNIADVGGHPVTGYFCVQPAQQFVRGGGGNVTASQACYGISVGVLQSGVTLADTSLTNPKNVCYQVTIKNWAQHPLASYACMQPSGSTFDFDTFVQASPPYIPTSFTVPQWSYNGTALPSTINLTGPGVSYATGTLTFGVPQTSTLLVNELNTTPISSTRLAAALLPQATNSLLGGVICDGTTINCNVGVISVTQGPIPASANVLGSNANGVPVVAISANIAEALSATPSPLSVSTLNATGATVTGNLKVEYSYPELDIVANGGTVVTFGLDATAIGGTKWVLDSTTACADSFIAQSGAPPNIVFYPAGQPTTCNLPNNGSTTAVDNLIIVGALTAPTVSATASVTTPVVANSAAQTSVTCATSGTAVFSMPEQGSSYKSVMIHLGACIGAASFTFPVAFSFPPQVSSQMLASTATSISATAVTVTGTASPGSTGFLKLDGY
jgi:hypothetical protein